MLATTYPTAEEWDDFVRQQPHPHILQLSAYAELKRAYGWEIERFGILDGEEFVGGAQVLFRPLPTGVSKMAYLAMGPYCYERQHWEYLWKAIKKCISSRRKAAFLKWEPGILPDGVPKPMYERWNFRPSLQTIQPPSTILINIAGEDDTIMARMNQGTRRKIRKSLKSDIHYHEGDRGDLERFAELMQTTGSRNDFGVHEAKYYRLAYDLFIEKGDGVLLVADHEDDLLAGIMVFTIGDTAWYLYGASSNIKRNLMATYGIQWQAIQWAKARGCTTYDLWGIPDESQATLEAQFKERSDGLWGVYGFKRGWGGEVVRSEGAWDKVYNPFIYKAYEMALKVMR